MDFEGGRLCVNAHVKRSIWAQQDSESKQEKYWHSGNTKSFTFYTTVSALEEDGINQGSRAMWLNSVGGPHLWNTVNHLTRYQIHLLSCKGEHSNPSQGSACRGPAGTVPLRQSIIPNSNVSLEKAFAALPFDSEDWDNWTSSRHCPGEQESCRRGT